MPDRRKHRGPHPKDAELFAEWQHEALRRAVSDLSWLLTRGYAPDSSLKLVGDRYQLVKRQRTAVGRAACTDHEAKSRRATRIDLSELEDRLLIDGFNLIVTLESAVAGGVLLLCRDGTVRDLASVHGSYRKVEETEQALDLAASVLSGALNVSWLLDEPVSNSGRLAGLIRSFNRERNLNWQVKLAKDVDSILIQTTHPVATADSIILNSAGPWVNLARTIVDGLNSVPVDLRDREA